MFKLRLVPAKTNVPFMGYRKVAFSLSGILVVASILILMISGLNLGIDFRGGILVEVKTPGPANLSTMRSALSGLGLGEVALQEFGAPDDVLIRVERQPGDSTAQQVAVDVVKETLTSAVGPGIDYRRVEFVGPKVSAELLRAGSLALLFALGAMLVYIWFRFEWQFSIGAVAALTHDVVLTFGMFAVTGLEFNLSSIAAILTIVGYSMNDTVVVYDRVRENLRKYKKLELAALLNLSMNDTLARTVMTSVTTLLALLALAIFGGAVISGFTMAMMWGVFVGTYSSIFVAAPLLIFFGIRRDRGEESNEAEGAETA
jgi:preprotein translocase SecF subunit